MSDIENQNYYYQYLRCILVQYLDPLFEKEESWFILRNKLCNHKGSAQDIIGELDDDERNMLLTFLIDLEIRQTTVNHKLVELIEHIDFGPWDHEKIKRNIE